MGDIVKHIEIKKRTMEKLPHLNAVERSRKLKSLQVTRNKLISYIQQKNKAIRHSEKEVAEAEKQLAEVEAEQVALTKAQGNAPIVTEHAMLRFLERRKGVNLTEVIKEILELDDKEKVVNGRTIVTVYTDKQDHFNLAEREAQ